MALPSERDVYDARCLRVASAAASQGVSFSKSDRRGKRSLEVSGNGRSIAFPIVTDERTWRETSVEQAFYSVLLDARSWSSAHVDAACLATFGADDERAEVPVIRTDFSERLARIEGLAAIVGGRAQLEDLLQSVDLATL